MSRFSPRISLVALVSLLMLLGPATSSSRELSGLVMRVLGPDSLEIKGPGEVLYSVHLRGTTAGNSGELAELSSNTELMSQLVGRYVTLTNVSGSGTRLEAVVEYGNADFNQELIRSGMHKFNDSAANPGLVYDYTTAEEKARIKSLGIWRPMEDRPSAPPKTLGPLEEPAGGWQFRPTEP